jgi:hypothetical protein
MHARIVSLFAAVLLALVVPAAAGAQGRAQQNLLDLGRQQYNDLAFEEALQTLSAAIIRPGNTRASELAAYELLGLSYLALNRNDEAEGAFRQVLIRDPAHTLSRDLAPRILAFFNTTRQRWEAEGRPGLEQATPRGPEAPVAPAAPQAVSIQHRSPAQQQRGNAVQLSATVTDPGHRVSRLVLAYRTASRGVFRRIDTDAQGGGAYTASIPADAVRPPLVEYYFEAVDSTGIPVQARGDAYAPLRVAVPEPGGVPWWVWVGGGALIAAAVITTVVVVSSQTAPASLSITISGQ